MYQKTKLKNNLTLITSPLKQTKAVTVLIQVPVGSRYEKKEINGMSHFVEHMMFKGTKLRPTTQDISKELDSVGAEYNAYTGKDHTGYYIKVTADKIELAFDILSDMLFNSVFDDQELQKEKGVIVEEINMYEDNPLMYVHGLFEEIVYGNHPLGWQISGPRSTVKSITRKQMVDYKNKYYEPANMVMTIAGNFSKAKVNTLTKKYFNAGSKSKSKKSFSKINIKQSAPKIRLINKNTEQVQVGLGFPAYGLDDPKKLPLSLLGIILGGNMSSRLFTVVREKHGLAYYVKADVSSYHDTGTLYIQAGLDRKRIKEAIKLILSELKKIKDIGVTDKELSDAKEFLKGKFSLSLEDSENIAEWLGRQQVLSNKIYTPEQKLKKIFAVKKDDIKKVAQEVIQSKHLSLALIGPFKDKKIFSKLLKI
ncbi:MAG: hypothetical protein CMI53_03720 [Parcubacteria group bacterium]|nr:hypothetical protein [Parcubacteria group bacterium]|tara:strand:- start:8299 stop:9567 length:1269 start_codon:yes stop_codon:yes gene_type:complete